MCAVYCSASGVKVFLNDSAFDSTDSTGDFPSDLVITDYIEMNQEFLNALCDRQFTQVDDEIEYVDFESGNLILLKNYPVVSVSEVGELQSDFTYTTLTDTRDTDTDSSFYLKDSSAGIIRLSDPIQDEQAYRVTYSYGYATVPKWVAKLCLLMTCRDVVMRLANSTDSTELMREWTRLCEKILDPEIKKLTELVRNRFRFVARAI